MGYLLTRWQLIYPSGPPGNPPLGVVPSQVSKLNRMPQKMARAGGYSRLPALILASVVEASANNFMAVLATSLYRAAVVMVGAAGQRIRTAGGASAGSTSSTLRVSPDWLMVPRDYFPKGTDLSTHSMQHLLAVENELNKRPRIVLTTARRPSLASKNRPRCDVD